MNIQVTLEREEFEPTLIELLAKALKRDISSEDVKSIKFDYADGKVSRMVAVVEPKQDANP